MMLLPFTLTALHAMPPLAFTRCATPPPLDDAMRLRRYQSPDKKAATSLFCCRHAFVDYAFMLRHAAAAALPLLPTLFTLPC